jgi:IS5 family transposase
VNADAKHKLIRHYTVTDAAVHDSQELDGLLDKGNTRNDVFADSAYRSAEIEVKLRASAYNSRIHRRGRHNHPLSLAQVRVREPDTRSHRACVRGAAERAGRADLSNDRHRAGARQDRLAEPGLQHSLPGDAGTARRGMKTVESSKVFQPKQWAEKEARKTIENRT